MSHGCGSRKRDFFGLRRGRLVRIRVAEWVDVLIRKRSSGRVDPETGRKPTFERVAAALLERGALSVCEPSSPDPLLRQATLGEALEAGLIIVRKRGEDNRMFDPEQDEPPTARLATLEWSEFVPEPRKRLTSSKRSE